MNAWLLICVLPTVHCQIRVSAPKQVFAFCVYCVWTVNALLIQARSGYDQAPSKRSKNEHPKGYYHCTVCGQTIRMQRITSAWLKFNLVIHSEFVRTYHNLPRQYSIPFTLELYDIERPREKPWRTTTYIQSQQNLCTLTGWQQPLDNSILSHDVCERLLLSRQATVRSTSSWSGPPRNLSV